MVTFLRALDFVLQQEGGYTDDPADPGGATNYGITQAIYSDWRRSEALPPGNVKSIQRHEVEAIYHQRYWQLGRCSQMRDRVAVAHFDCAVHCGPYAAAKILQRAAGVKDDGIIGPVTLAAVRVLDEDLLFDAMLWERMRYYRDITREESEALVQLAAIARAGNAELANRAEGLKFLRWWIKRVLDLREAA